MQIAEFQSRLSNLLGQDDYFEIKFRLSSVQLFYKRQGEYRTCFHELHSDDLTWEKLPESIIAFVKEKKNGPLTS